MRFNREAFFSAIRKAWGGLRQKQVDALTDLLEMFETDVDMTDVRWISYALGTIKHETAGTYLPIAEYGKGKGKPYGKRDRETGQTYYGRGYVQLTHRDNYEKFSEVLGLDLVNRPDLAMDADTAYSILSLGMREGMFTGKRLSGYINGVKCDYLNARRIINAMDKAALIASYAKVFEGALEEMPELNGEATESATTAVSTVTTTTTEAPPADGIATTVKETVATVTNNATVKDVAKTGMSAVGNRIAQGGLSTGGFGAVWGVVTGNWKAVVGGLVFLLVGAGIWALVYYQRKQIQILTAQILSDRNRDDVQFVKQ